MDNNNVNNIADINKALAKNYIHYEPSRTDYSINSFELELIEQTGSSIWKDVLLTCLGLGVPCIINGIADYSTLPAGVKSFTADIFLNALFGIISIVLGIISLIVWQKNKTSFKKVIARIKNKPKYEMPNKS
jgi:hypothetical protein